MAFGNQFSLGYPFITQATKPTSAPTINAQVGGDWLTSLGKFATDYGPLMSAIGGILSGGKATPMGQIGELITQQLTSQKLNEAVRKMLQDLMGQSTGELGKIGGPKVGLPQLTGTDVVGLAPEQVGALYRLGMEVRKAEMDRPLDIVSRLADVRASLAAGDLSVAQAQKILKDIEARSQELSQAPITNYLDLLKRIEDINKVQEDIRKTKEEIGKITAERGVKEEEKKKVIAETKAIYEKLDPAAVHAIERAKAMGRDYELVDQGNMYSLINKVTGKVIAMYPKAAPPEAPTKGLKEQMTFRKEAYKAVSPYAVRVLEAQLAAGPGGKRAEEIRRLIESLRNIATGEVDPSAVIAKLSPENRRKLEKAVDFYMKNMDLPEDILGGTIEQILGYEEISETSPTGERSLITKYLHRTPEKQAKLMEGIVNVLKGRDPHIYEVTAGGVKYRVEWDGKSIKNIRPIK